MHKVYQPMISKLLLRISDFHQFDCIRPFPLQQ